jgi:uncharacterized membrane protein YvlD (DUF360 family)
MLISRLVSGIVFYADSNDMINPFKEDVGSFRGALANMPDPARIGIKWVVSIVALLLFSFMFGKRVRYQGVLAFVTVALIVAPAYMLVPLLITTLHLPSPDSTVTILLATTFVNAVLLYTCSYIVPDFEIDHFAVAVALAALMALFGHALSIYTGDQRFSVSVAAPLGLWAARSLKPSSRPSIEEP